MVGLHVALMIELRLEAAHSLPWDPLLRVRLEPKLWSSEERVK